MDVLPVVKGVFILIESSGSDLVAGELLEGEVNIVHGEAVFGFGVHVLGEFSI